MAIVEELIEFPIVSDTGKVINLLVTEEEKERGMEDSDFLFDLVEKNKRQKSNNDETYDNSDENYENDENEPINRNKVGKSKTFIWPDKAVLLLIELYREREDEFSNGLKRSNKIWSEISSQMRELNAEHVVTGQQCSSKMAGLKRTYKHIVDVNKKSGNNRTSWTFFPVMDSLFGSKAYIKPLAIATSDGPLDPDNPEPGTSTSTSIDSLKGSKNTKKRMANLMEQFFENIKEEKEERKEEKRREEANRERRHEENRKDREKRHSEQIETQKSLISILQECLQKT